MNVTTVFTSATSRPEPTPRADATMRPDATPRAADGEQSDDEKKLSDKSAASRAEFAAVLALLAGAGTKVRTDLLKQIPAEGASLIDQLLEGSALTDNADALGGSGNASRGPTVLMPTVDTLAAAMRSSSQHATDALRYGILKENTGTHPSTDLAVLQAALTAANAKGTDVSGSAKSPTGADRARLNELLGRIVSRRGASVDQLMALGDDQGADVRSALDRLIASAGTPAGLELSGAAATAALSAATAALTSAKVASAADVTTPVNDTDALAPELRQKLNRVISRMKNEYGNDVTVVETARSQERQDFLFEQGRTRPGAVVTWTRDSAHTRGDAVDVVVDGSWDNTPGFARLQRIAKEEGLRTLGVRDPGHLELAKRSVGGELANATPNSVREQQPVPLISTPAGQANVARIAGVAGVARVARPGTLTGTELGASRGLDRNYTAKTDAPIATTIASVTGPASENGRGNAFGRGERDDRGRPMNDGRALGASRRESLGAAELSAFGTSQQPTNIAAAATESAAPAAGVASAERVADIQQMQADAPAGSVSRLTLNIDAPDGGQDRITIDLRGNAVGTQINTDAANADRLRVRTAELQDALGRHGLDSDTVRISSVARAEQTDASRAIAGERDGLRLNAAQQAATGDGTNNQGRQERSANAREFERPASSRQTREEKQDERQGAGQRGQRGTSNRSAT